MLKSICNIYCNLDAHHELVYFYYTCSSSFAAISKSKDEEQHILYFTQIGGLHKLVYTLERFGTSGGKKPFEVFAFSLVIMPTSLYSSYRK